MATVAIAAAAAELVRGTDECEMRLAVTSSQIVLGVVLGFGAFAAVIWASVRSGGG